MSGPQRQSKKGVFYGWWVVAACTIGISTGPGPFAFASLGLFMRPFEQEFGWGRGEVSVVLSILIVATALSLPFIGRIVDRVGARRVLLPSLIAMAACLGAIPLFVSELWHLAVVFLLIGTIAAGTNSVPYMPVLSAWFIRRRGLAIGISIAGIGLGYAYVPLLVQYMIDQYGWRSGYYALAGIVVLVSWPVIFLLFRDTPAQMGLEPDGATTGVVPRAASRTVGHLPREILRRSEFWMLVVIFVTLSFVLNGLLAHLVPMLTDRGMKPSAAASVAATEGVTVFFSRIMIGFLMDRFFAPHVAMVFFALSAIGLGMFVMGAVGPTAFAAIVLVGLSLGAEVDILAYLTGRYFGLRSFGAAYGLLFAAILVGTALGPVAFGYGFELTGSYTDILLICVGINLVAVVVMALLGPYPDWEVEPESGRQ